MNVEECVRMMGLLEKLCPLDLYKVSVNANTLLELHGALYGDQSEIEGNSGIIMFSSKMTKTK